MLNKGVAAADFEGFQRDQTVANWGKRLAGFEGAIKGFVTGDGNGDGQPDVLYEGAGKSIHILKAKPNRPDLLSTVQNGLRGILRVGVRAR